MAKISLNKAAKLAGKSRNTLSAHIEKGTLSAEKNEQGHWRIDVAELERVYGTLLSVSKQDNGQPSTVDHSRNALTEQRIALLEQENSFLKRQLEDAKVEKEDWKEQARTAQRLLKAWQGEESQPITTAPAKKKPGFLARLFGAY